MRSAHRQCRLLTASALLLPLAIARSSRPPPAAREVRQVHVQHATGGGDRQVKDKNGKPIEGLTAKDFTVTENGVPQTISFCEFQKLEDVDAGAGASPRPPCRSAGRASGRRPSRSTQIAPEAPGDIRYRDRRLLALYFDMSAMPRAGPVARAHAPRRSSSRRR